MKIQVASDLHLEFGPITLKPVPDADCLILAGDIGTPVELVERFIKYNLEYFEHIIFVPGNHEFYGSSIDSVEAAFKAADTYGGRVHRLCPGTTTINGVRFAGATMWTDLDKGCNLAKYDVARYMNDFRRIKYHGMQFNINLWADLNVRDMVFLRSELKSDTTTPTVVITHHAPTILSINDKYRTESNKFVNHGFYSDCSELIYGTPNIKYWIHGHTHSNVEYQIGNTTVIANPLGYCMNALRDVFTEFKDIEGKYDHILRMENEEFKLSKVFEI